MNKRVLPRFFHFIMRIVWCFNCLVGAFRRVSSSEASEGNQHTHPFLDFLEVSTSSPVY